jgi:hypothetical protein
MGLERRCSCFGSNMERAVVRYPRSFDPRPNAGTKLAACMIRAHPERCSLGTRLTSRPFCAHHIVGGSGTKRIHIARKIMFIGRKATRRLSNLWRTAVERSRKSARRSASIVAGTWSSTCRTLCWGDFLLWTPSSIPGPVAVRERGSIGCATIIRASSCAMSRLVEMPLKKGFCGNCRSTNFRSGIPSRSSNSRHAMPAT